MRASAETRPTLRTEAAPTIDQRRAARHGLTSIHFRMLLIRAEFIGAQQHRSEQEEISHASAGQYSGTHARGKPGSEPYVVYEVRYEACHARAGTRRQVTRTFRTHHEADAFLQARLAQIDTVAHPRETDVTLAQWLQIWLDCKRADPDFQITAHANYRCHVQNHILPTLGQLRLQDLTAAHLDRLSTAQCTGTYKDGTPVRKDGKLGALSPCMVRLTHTLLHQSLALAQRQGLVAWNVANEAHPPKKPEPQNLRVWTIEELKAFERLAADQRYGPLWLIIGHTGVRRGEALGWQWADFDLAAGTLSVRRTVSLHKGRPLVKRPKTSKSRREILLTGTALAALLAWRDRQGARGLARPTMHIFCKTTDRSGGPLDPASVGCAYRRLRRRAAALGIPPIRLHDLRHTHASHLVEAGASLKEIQDRLGHAHLDTTEIYLHTPEAMKRHATTVFERLYGEADMPG